MTLERRWAVFGVPFALSLLLSAVSVGTHIYWQDSGFYLNAVHDLGVLYPHGFVVYQMLCKLWTTIFFFLDFVLAVHLFSSACAALAAAVVALAVRDAVEKDVPAILAGCILASGYTFWFSGLYAKVYALFYLVLAVLLLAIVRSSKNPTRRGTAAVAALAGLAWSVHPSVALGGLGLAWYFWRVSKTVGLKTIVVCVGLGLVVALAPGLLLPLLSARDVERSLGHPQSVAQVFTYLLGSRYTGIPGVFGWEGSRGVHLLRFLWEEYLLVGLLMAGVGVFELTRSRKPAVIGGVLWTLPYLLVTTLFKIEGQSDHWSLAACLPLSIAMAAGFARIPDLRVPVVLGVVAVLHSVVANARDLQLRNDDLAEVYGKLYLQNLEPNALLFAQSDDVVSTTWALQSVRGQRADVIVVSASQLGADEIWYDLSLKRHHPELQLPTEVPPNADLEAIVAAWLKANAAGARPLYVTMPIRSDWLPAGRILVPQGVVWRLLPAEEDRIRIEHWTFPLEPEELPARFGRRRGLSVTAVPGGFETEPEAYERRLQKALLKGRTLLADWQFRHSQPAAALKLYESILRLDPKGMQNEAMLHNLALCYLGTGRKTEAAEAFRATLAVAVRPWTRASSWLALGDLARGRGDEAEAHRCYEEASRIGGLTPQQQDAVRERQR